MHAAEASVVIGLTGNIASGKSHIAEIFKSQGALVQNSDIVAHQVMEEEALAEIAKHFPNVIENGMIDRKKLGSEVFADEKKLKLLESILHPQVRARNIQFIKSNPGKIIVLEIPLLFETAAEQICDYVVFVHVQPKTQKQRALARPNMGEKKLAEILIRQEKITVKDKIEKSDFVIENEPGNDITKSVENILQSIRNCAK